MEKPSTQRIAVSIAIVLIGSAWFAAPWYSVQIIKILNQLRCSVQVIKLVAQLLASEWFRIGAVFAGSAIAGAGIGNLFRRPWVGALCGLSLYMTIRVIIVVFVHHLRLD